MKKIITVLGISLSLATFAQVVNYKKLNLPTVDAAGIVYNAKSEKIGSVDESGIIKNADGEKIASIDAFGTVTVDESGKKVVKCNKDGNLYAIQISKTSFKGWDAKSPEPGVEICLLKDKKGKLVAGVHKHYRQFGGAAIYLLIKKQ